MPKLPKRGKPAKQPDPMRNLKPLPKQRGKEARAKYLARKSVQRWLARNAEGLKRVVDIRHTYQRDGAEHIEWAEILYVVKRDGEKMIKRRIISGDPPPR